MSPRERLLAVLSGTRPDRVPWFGDLDYWAGALIERGDRPADFRASSAYLDWHRELGVGYYLQGYFPFLTHLDLEERTWRDGHRRYRELVTPAGTLRECWEYLPESFTEAPVEHLAKSERDLPALRYVYEHMAFEPDYDFARRRAGQIGDQGVLLTYLPKSPLMQLVVMDMGIGAVAFAEAGAPDEFARTVEAVERAQDAAARIALGCPGEAVMIPENLSSEMIGPRLFDAYARPYQERWFREIGRAGKHSFVHMDGTLRGLLRRQASTGVRVIEAMTPHPVGDLPVAGWAAHAGTEDTVLWGGIPGTYFTPHVADAEFDRHIVEVLSVMRSAPRYVLGVADQVPPDALERRVRRVAELVETEGVY